MRNILRSAILGAVVIAGTPVIANALVFNILAESSPFNPTNFGQIGAGENIFSGNIDGSCLIGSSAPDCSFGDTSDLFSFSLADDFEILGATFTVTNYVTNGFNGLFGTSLDNVSFRSDSGGFSTNFNGNTARDLTPSFFGQDAAGDFLLSVAVLGVTQDFNGSTIQGVGDIAFDYQLNVDVADFSTPVAAVPLPAGLPLLAAGLGMLGFLRLRRRSVISALKLSILVPAMLLPAAVAAQGFKYDKLTISEVLDLPDNEITPVLIDYTKNYTGRSTFRLSDLAQKGLVRVSGTTASAEEQVQFSLNNGKCIGAMTENQKEVLFPAFRNVVKQYRGFKLIQSGDRSALDTFEAYFDVLCYPWNIDVWKRHPAFQG